MMESMGYGSIYEACLKSNANFSSESILVNIGKALDLDINDKDISIAHPLPSYINEALPKTYGMLSMAKEMACLNLNRARGQI